MNFVTAILFFGLLSILLAALLVYFQKRFAVVEDPRIDEVEAMLPHANCGACGYAGCRQFAQALVAGEAPPALCTVSNPEDRQLIANRLGIDPGSIEKRVARLACAGGSNVARMQAHYHGAQTCNAATTVSGGGKACSWGCLGLGDCANVCQFGAITLNAFNLPVVDEVLCTACGDCVTACPKNLFSIHPVSHHLWVACKNQESGDQILENCQVACTACGRCALDAPYGLITMQHNLPMIDYPLNSDSKEAIQRCPTGAIFWIKSGNIVKGPKSPKSHSHTPLNSAPS